MMYAPNLEQWECYGCGYWETQDDRNKSVRFREY